MSFDELGLRVELLKAVDAKGYTAPTPIQAKTIPVILDGRDVLARARPEREKQMHLHSRWLKC